MVEGRGIYHFKDIPPVLGSSDLVDVVLSGTQRKTPTQVHPQYKISRIRSFYTRKVKFAQQTFHDKLTSVISKFPRIDDIHPFYGDLLNVLYDRDHFKLALAQCNMVRGNIDAIAKDYVKLLKYADSPFKCKTLKRAALGRMATFCKKLGAALRYLEEVRQHMARLPAVNPSTPSVLLAGYPNVGKSSMMNAVSAANVEVQPFPFTTKMLYVGHFDYDYAKWQIIDTPGVLDRPLANRNSIELTAITAMAHLNAVIVYLLDLSETCGYGLEDQVKLFLSLKVLFENKPVVIAMNKIDLVSHSDLSQTDKNLIESMGEGLPNCCFIACSSLLNQGVSEVRDTACRLLTERIDSQKTQALKAASDNIKSSLFSLGTAPKPFTAEVVIPADRQPCIPQSVLIRQQQLAQLDEAGQQEYLKQRRAMMKLEKDLEDEMGGPGVYQSDDRKRWLLENEEWKYDRAPEFFNGKNIADFVNTNLDLKLKELEMEEAELLRLDAAEADGRDDESIWFTKRIFKELRDHANLGKISRRLKRVKHLLPMKRVETEEYAKRMEDMGLNPAGLIQAAKPRTAALRDLVHESDEEPEDSDDEAALEGIREIEDTRSDEEDMGDNTGGSALAIVPGETRVVKVDGKRRKLKILPQTLRKASAIDPVVANKPTHLLAESILRRKLRDYKLARGKGELAELKRRRRLPMSRVDMSLGNSKSRRRKVEQIERRVQKVFKTSLNVNEADRHVDDMKPKHLYCGKRGIGKTSRR